MQRLIRLVHQKDFLGLASAAALTVTAVFLLSAVAQAERGDTYECPPDTVDLGKVDDLGDIAIWTVPDSPENVTAVVIKAGNAGHVTVWASNGDDIDVKGLTGHGASHAHLCGSPPTTTTTGVTTTWPTSTTTSSSTTTAPPSTTTPPTSTTLAATSTSSSPATTTTTTAPPSTTAPTSPTSSTPGSTTSVAVDDPPVPTTVFPFLPATGSTGTAWAVAAALLGGLGVVMVRAARR